MAVGAGAGEVAGEYAVASGGGVDRPSSVLFTPSKDTCGCRAMVNGAGDGVTGEVIIGDDDDDDDNDNVDDDAAAVPCKAVAVVVVVPTDA